jgi:hypothetical protein
MQKPALKRKHWPLLAVIVLAAVFAGEAVVKAQFRGQPRPGGPVGQPARPFPQPNLRPRPPAVPRGNPQIVLTVTVYTCTQCGREVGRGPVPPQRPCPFCGFDGEPLRAAGHDVQPRWPGRVSPTFLYTVASEAAVLVGMLVVGIIRVAVDRSRTRGAAADGQ